jgi:hypothetical protein
MTSNGSSDEKNTVERHRWWRFWKWSLGPYRSRADRLSADAQGDASSYWLRGGR